MIAAPITAISSALTAVSQSAWPSCATMTRKPLRQQMVDGHAIEHRAMASSPHDRDVRIGVVRAASVGSSAQERTVPARAGLRRDRPSRRSSERESRYREKAATFSNQTDLVALRLMRKIDPAEFRKQADECHEQANEARNPIDQEAWLRLAEDFIKLAERLEQVRYLRASRPGVDTMPRRTL
jgi:hypothetical protein